MFLYSHWLELPLSTRALLAQQFGFTKTGSTHVSDNRIVDDGYKLSDIEHAINIDAIQTFLGLESSTDMNILWDLMIAKVEGRSIESVNPEVTDEQVASVEAPADAPKKRGRPKKI